LNENMKEPKPNFAATTIKMNQSPIQLF